MMAAQRIALSLNCKLAVYTRCFPEITFYPFSTSSRITGGELFERVIDDEFVLTEKACTVFMRQICEGVDFIHSSNILHLDLKPENILCLTKTGNRIKIIDFGLAVFFDPQKKLQVLFGTPEFAAPEVVNFEPIGCYTDMWSIGVICYVL